MFAGVLINTFIRFYPNQESEELKLPECNLNGHLRFIKMIYASTWLIMAKIKILSKNHPINP